MVPTEGVQTCHHLQCPVSTHGLNKSDVLLPVTGMGNSGAASRGARGPVPPPTGNVIEI